jgi:hypothetical protein
MIRDIGFLEKVNADKYIGYILAFLNTKLRREKIKSSFRKAAQLPVQIVNPSPSYINYPSWYDPSSDPTPCEYFLGESLKNYVCTNDSHRGWRQKKPSCGPFRQSRQGIETVLLRSSSDIRNI